MYFCSLTSNNVCWLFDYLPIFNLILLVAHLHVRLLINLWRMCVWEALITFITLCFGAVYPGPEARPAFCTKGYWVFPVVKQLEPGADHIPLSSVGLRLVCRYIPHLPLYICRGVTFTFTLRYYSLSSHTKTSSWYVKLQMRHCTNQIHIRTVSGFCVLSLLICIQEGPASVVGIMISQPHISCISSGAFSVYCNHFHLLSLFLACKVDGRGSIPSGSRNFNFPHTSARFCGSPGGVFRAFQQQLFACCKFKCEATWNSFHCEGVEFYVYSPMYTCLICRLSTGISSHLRLYHLTPNDHFSSRTAPLTSRCCIF